MPAPLVGAAAAAAAKLIARKIAKDKAKKSIGKIVKGSDVAKAVKKINVNAKKAEAKANTRGLKAASGKLSKGNAKRMYDKDKVEMIMKANPKDSAKDASMWARHPGYASQKSNARLQKGKDSSEKQIARYQKSEIKDFRKLKKKAK